MHVAFCWISFALSNRVLTNHFSNRSFRIFFILPRVLALHVTARVPAIRYADVIFYVIDSSVIITSQRREILERSIPAGRNSRRDAQRNIHAYTSTKIYAGTFCRTNEHTEVHARSHIALHKCTYPECKNNRERIA